LAHSLTPPVSTCPDAGTLAPVTDDGGTADHYFTASPASPDQRREISTTLAGIGVAVETAPGVFSASRIDLGTSVLLRTVPAPPPGTLLDLGCGWGPIALTMALLQPQARVWAVDVNERALDLVRRNAGRVAQIAPAGEVIAASPDEVPSDLEFDAIWSNPPVRIGKDALHGLLARWLPRLAPGAEAHLVVQRNLGADSLARWLAEQRDDAGLAWGEVDKVASAKGFRVLRVRRPWGVARAETTRPAIQSAGKPPAGGPTS
jgi:16S rRNA (guanine1207-N2)-methyltransferase